MSEINSLNDNLSRYVTQLLLSIQVDKKVDSDAYKRLSDILKDLTVSLKYVEFVSKKQLLVIHKAIHCIINEYAYLDSDNLAEAKLVVSQLQQYFYFILNNEKYDERVPGVPRIF